MHRRTFLKQSAALAACSVLPRFAFAASDEIPWRALTGLPGHHWFGYYDKIQFSPDSRYVLGMETGFEGRTPGKDDVIGVGMVDLGMNDRWIEFGKSRAWSWQQGCMLQFVPNAGNTVIWNDAEDASDGRRFISHILNVETGAHRTLPRAIYAVSPDGKSAVTADFARIDRMRVGYGYVGGRDATYDDPASPEGGIYRMDLETGESTLIVSYADVARIPHLGRDVSGKWHYFNHLLISPDGKRFLFLNRYRDFPLTPEMRADPDANRKYVQGKYTTRMFTAGLEGSGLYQIDPGDTSHIIWRDPQSIIAWTAGQKWEENRRPHGFWLLKDRTDEAMLIGEGIMTENGHQTYVPGTNNEWILNDTYPNQERIQTLYLYHIPTSRKIVLGRFFSPPQYVGEWRTDLHPRTSRDGKLVCIDSTHEDGKGRQLYLLDISGIVGV